MKIGQKNLCQGICSRGTLSRFENGRQTLSYNRVSALFQRLGLPDNCFYALLSEDELALKEAEREARDASVELERALAQGRPAAWARLREALGRIRDRYVWCYRANGYSRWYLVECIAIECVKMVFG